MSNWRSSYRSYITQARNRALVAAAAARPAPPPEPTERQALRAAYRAMEEALLALPGDAFVARRRAFLAMAVVARRLRLGRLERIRLFRAACNARRAARAWGRP